MILLRTCSGDSVPEYPAGIALLLRQQWPELATARENVTESIGENS